MTPNKFEFYVTPSTFVHYLFREVPITGTIFEPCVGEGDIIAASRSAQEQAPPGSTASLDRTWLTNDLDPLRTADWNLDAATPKLWEAAKNSGAEIDFTVTNPPFTACIDILDLALKYSRVGVAMHLRASIHEVLKTGVRRTWMADHTPTGILWLPRFGYQRSKTTGKWTTDSVCACWLIWSKIPGTPQFIKYAPEWVIEALEAETPIYRKRMDALMGVTL